MATPEARARALSWFDDDQLIEEFCRYETLYSELPRKLFLEIGLALMHSQVRTVLDTNAGSGVGLQYLRSRLPQARLYGLALNSRMLGLARQNLEPSVQVGQGDIETLPASEPFDLIYSYSSLRFWEQPVATLQRIAKLLTPSGRAYIVDFRGDIDADLRDQLMARLVAPVHRSFLQAQLDASWPVSDVAKLVRQAGVRARVAVGGLGGYPTRSAEAFDLLRRNDHISACLLGLTSYGFRSSRAAELVFHLIIEAEDLHAATTH